MKEMEGNFNQKEARFVSAIVETKIYGKTGEIGKDGLLTAEQQALLNRIQERASRSSLTYLSAMKDEDSSPMVAMATGIGKGRIIHKVIERQMRQKPDSKVLVVAGTKLVLVKQTHQALRQYQEITANGNGSSYIESEEDDKVNSATASMGDNPLEDQQSFLYSTGRLRQQDANVHIATIQSVQSEISRGRLNPDDYDLLIVDEVHNIGTKKRKEVIDKFKKAVGFTATAYRHSGRIKTPEQYGFGVVESLSLPKAQELRLLPPLLGIQLDTKDLVEEVPTTSTGKIDFAKLEKLLKNSPDLRPFIAERVAKIITDGERRYKTVIAVNFVWEAQELAQLLKDKGIKVGVAVNQQAAKEIHSDEIPAINAIERYKLPEDDKDSIQVLISPYVASEGFDAPATEVLVWASPTDSELRYTQYTGRLARRNEGKLFGVVVDCLYQTSQYSWSYNMGMWMKDDIKQLDNGMLWLGPETDMESLKKLPQVEAIRKQADIKPLTDLQKEGLLELQETDFIVSLSNLRKVHKGRNELLLSIARNIVEQLRTENPDLIAIRKVARREKTYLVVVITDKDRFIREFKKISDKEIKDRDRSVFKKRLIEIENQKIPLQENDFLINRRNLESVFYGDHRKIMPIAQSVIERMLIDDPWVVTEIKSRGRILKIVKNKHRFIEMMLTMGLKLREKSDISSKEVRQPGFIISNKRLAATFRGDHSRNKIIAREVAMQLKRSDPHLVTEDRVKGQLVMIITDKEAFFQGMEARGIKLKKK